MHRSALVLAALTALVCLGAVPAFATSSPSGAGKAEVTFGIQAATGDRGDARPNFQFGGGAGSAPFHDTVSVLNIGTVPLHLALYPADAQSTTNGQFAVKLESQKQDDVGSWITLAKGPQITVPARSASTGASRIFVPFTLTIPHNATPGDHVGAIMVSLLTKAATSGRANEAIDKRIGIRVYVRVSGVVHAALSITRLHSGFGPQFAANPFGTGHVSVSYVVSNTGNVILGGRQQVAVSGLLGGARTWALPTIAPLLPGNSIRVRSVVTGVFPEFRETTKVTVHPLAQVGAVDASLATVTRSATTWAVPWLLIVLVIVVLGVGCWYLRRRLTSGGVHSKASHGAKRTVTTGKDRS